MNPNNHRALSQQTHDKEVWQSKSRSKPNEQIPVDVAHRALFERTEAAVSSAFALVQRALVDLQLQLQIKLRQLMEQQELILQTQQPSDDAQSEFEENVKKIDRSLESFTAHADNLSHIRLTLARAAAFVSPEGNLAQLVCKATSHTTRRSEQWPVSQQNQMEESNNMHMTNNLTMEVPTRTTALSSLPPPWETTTSFFTPQLNPNSNTFQPLDDADGRSNSRLLSPVSSTEDSNFRRLAERLKEKETLLGLSSSSNRVPNSTCFVFYLPPSATNETLRYLFMRYGTVLNAYVAMDKVTNRTRGFGFVDFSSPSEAQAAVAALDKYPLDGKFLSVSIKV